jgi:hypothetical protein
VLELNFYAAQVNLSKKCINKKFAFLSVKITKNVGAGLVPAHIVREHDKTISHREHRGLREISYFLSVNSVFSVAKFLAVCSLRSLGRHKTCPYNFS